MKTFLILLLVALFVGGIFGIMFYFMNAIDKCYNNGCSLANQKCKDPNYKCEAK